MQTQGSNPGPYRMRDKQRTALAGSLWELDAKCSTADTLRTCCWHCRHLSWSLLGWLSLILPQQVTPIGAMTVQGFSPSSGLFPLTLWMPFGPQSLIAGSARLLSSGYKRAPGYQLLNTQMLQIYTHKGLTPLPVSLWRFPVPLFPGQPPCRRLRRPLQATCTVWTSGRRRASALIPAPGSQPEPQARLPDPVPVSLLLEGTLLNPLSSPCFCLWP